MSTVPLQAQVAAKTLQPSRPAGRDPESARRLREAVKAAALKRPALTIVPRLRAVDAGAFRGLARAGLPLLIEDLVSQWPLSRLSPADLAAALGPSMVTVRGGDYVQHAFSRRRHLVDMPLGDYLTMLAGLPADGLPPYLGNQALPGLDPLCQWPDYFPRPGATRVWLGPAGTVTPLHCDFTDNLFAQVWGRKRFVLLPPHLDGRLYTREANPLLYASHFDPEAPDFDRFPLACGADALVCDLAPGDLLYLPAGWFHKVRSLTLSLSANRWTHDTPWAIADWDRP